MLFDHALEELCADVQGTLHRFSGNRALLKKFMLKFPQDTTFEELGTAVVRGDYEAVETTAHTLKGVAANLGFVRLYETCGDLVQAVRQGQYESISALFELTKEEYEKIVSCLSRVED